MVLNGTLSCGLLGPETHGATVDKSNSKTAPEKFGSVEASSYFLNNP